jgi:HNH endonuclease
MIKLDRGPRVSLDEARSLSLKYYYTGESCLRGHIGFRRTKDRACVECKIKWRVENRDKEASTLRNWRLRNRENCTEYARKRHNDNRDKIAAYRKKWRSENSEKYADSRRKYRLKNPEYERVKNSKRRGAGGRFTAEQVRNLAEKQKHRCANSCCRKSIRDSYHVDHIMPIALGGDNDIKNIQLLCPPCNLTKSAKHPVVWAHENGRLL